MNNKAYEHWLSKLPALTKDSAYINKFKDKLLYSSSKDKDQFIYFIQKIYIDNKIELGTLNKEIAYLADQGVSANLFDSKKRDQLSHINNGIYKFNQELYKALTPAEKYSLTKGTEYSEEHFSLTKKLVYTASIKLEVHDLDRPIRTKLANLAKPLHHSVKLADTSNIQTQAPILNAEQIEDTKKVEEALFINKARGFLFANGTGTGKTALALNVVNRQHLLGKDNILIVVSNQNKIKDWQEEAIKFFNFSIPSLKDTTDAGTKIRITTYANFRDNHKLVEQHFNLIVYDESHNLSLGNAGHYTKTLNHHRKITQSNFSQETIDKIKNSYFSLELSNDEFNQYIDYIKRHINFKYNQIKQSDGNPILEKFIIKVGKEKHQNIYKQVQNNITKTIFLSATPYAYRSSMAYTEDILHGSVDDIALHNLGYKIRYNKVTRPKHDVESKKLQQLLHENLIKQGCFSKRSLNIEADYSRDFCLSASPYLEQIDYLRDYDNREIIKANLNSDENTAFKAFHECLKGSNIYKIFEQEKLASLHQRIDQHLILKRKVIIFHQYKHHNPLCPLNSLLPHLKDGEFKQRIVAVLAARRTTDIYGLNDRYANQSFLYNGDVSAAKRNAILKQFKDDNSDCKILIVQSQAGREGLNLHDSTGLYPRVTIDLSLPTSPTEIIQKEGRIYRTGTQTNAIHEYIVTHASTEKWVFGYNISQRVDFVENLALGFEARNMADLIKNGYQQATAFYPNVKQGIGGKKEKVQAKFENQISSFEMASLDYQKRQQKTSAQKSQEGVDYYATPEPIGYMFMQWLNLNHGDKILEPSAGDGAIAKYAPTQCTIHAVEPSFALSSQLINNINGVVNNTTFEDYDIANKFDGIAMNPPFGCAGVTAIQHLTKALHHLKNNGRLAVIFPEGSAITKLDKVLADKEYANFYKIAELLLPTCTFNKAATNVATKIIIFDKIQAEVVQAKSYCSTEEVRIDLTSCTNNTELFKRIEKIKIPSKNNLVFTKDKILSNLIKQDEVLETTTTGIIVDKKTITTAKTEYEAQKQTIFNDSHKYFKENNISRETEQNRHIEDAIRSLDNKLKKDKVVPKNHLSLTQAKLLAAKDKKVINNHGRSLF